MASALSGGASRDTSKTAALDFIDCRTVVTFEGEIASRSNHTGADNCTGRVSSTVLDVSKTDDQYSVIPDGTYAGPLYAWFQQPDSMVAAASFLWSL